MAIEARDPETGKVVGVFASACEAAKIVGTVSPKQASNNIMRCIRGGTQRHRHTAYGMVWREIEMPTEMLQEQEQKRAERIANQNRELKRRTYERLKMYRSAGGNYSELVRPGLPSDTIFKMAMAWDVPLDKWRLLDKALRKEERRFA